jgi:hypothetical protein
MALSLAGGHDDACRTEQSICIPGGLRREREYGICGGPGLADHDRRWG